MSQDERLASLQATLGYKPLHRGWAKLEIWFGLVAVGVGLLLSQWGIKTPAIEEGTGFILAGLVLFILGGYLAMAGHRSHLYQSQNEGVALLLEEIHRLRDKGYSS